MAYIRFVIPHVDKQSRRRQGLFRAMGTLIDADALLPHERATYDEIYAWFSVNLKRPSLLRRARSWRPGERRAGANIALSWFKDSAIEHIRRMRTIAEILREHGLIVQTIVTEKPGYVVYEDAHQVAAEPFEETGA